MGRGGDSTHIETRSTKKLKLAKLETEELRKWANVYGVKDHEKLDRDVLLKELNAYADGILDPLRPANLPLAPPKFTLKTIRDAIPDECFKRSLVTSFTHLFTDLLIIAILGFAATKIHLVSSPVPQYLSSNVLQMILWPLYWYAQGSVMTGVWVIAHECGHQAFSDYQIVNNIVGTIFHSALLVPFHPWRITHGRHHNNTGSCENDEVFAPSTRADWAGELMRESPIAQLWGIFVMLTVGWWPGYLVFNATGPAKYRGKNANHLSPNAAFFDKKDYWLVIQSDLALFTAVGLLIYAIYTLGFQTVGAYYLLPEMIVNLHLVLITYLQHTDVFMPHFRGKEWNWLRGALCTVDRSYGWLLDHTFHHITDTHVCHHLFSTMPFYNAEVATKHIKEVLGPYYMKDDTPIMHALYRSYKSCQFVEDDGEIVWYKNVK